MKPKTAAEPPAAAQKPELALEQAPEQEQNFPAALPEHLPEAAVHLLLPPSRSRHPALPEPS